MADISKITLPDGNTYNIKDTVARSNTGGNVDDVYVNGASVVTSRIARVTDDDGNFTLDGELTLSGKNGKDVYLPNRSVIRVANSNGDYENVLSGSGVASTGEEGNLYLGWGGYSGNNGRGTYIFGDRNINLDTHGTIDLYGTSINAHNHVVMDNNTGLRWIKPDGTTVANQMYLSSYNNLVIGQTDQNIALHGSNFDVNTSGKIVSQSSITVQGHASPIGELHDFTEGTYSAGTGGNWNYIMPFTLEQGKWLVIIRCTFPAAFTGVCRAGIARYTNSSWSVLLHTRRNAQAVTSTSYETIVAVQGILLTNTDASETFRVALGVSGSTAQSVTVGGRYIRLE